MTFNLNSAAEWLPILAAAAQGKVIQKAFPTLDNTAWVATGSIDMDDKPSRYRVGAEPQLRDWLVEEIPIGGIIRLTDRTAAQTPQVILYAKWSTDTQARAVVLLYDTTVVVEFLRRHAEWQYPGQTEWKPCGVME